MYCEIGCINDKKSQIKPLEASLGGEAFACPTVLVEVEGLNHCSDVNPLEATCTCRTVDLPGLMHLQGVHELRED